MKKSSKQKKEQLNNLFAVYNKRLEALYNDYVNRLTSLGLTSLDNADEMFDKYTLFNFNNFPDLKARLDDIFEDYFQNNIVCVKNGITDGVALAFKHDSNALDGFSVLSDKTIHLIRETAAETFIRSRFKSKKGLNLSQSIWNYCQQTKSEFEMGMSNVIADGLKKGTSAEELGRKLRTYLNNPDMMYRRYHTTIALSNGTKKDIVTWRRRRIIDGKVRFIEEPLEKVGRGVYRSARKNALRVARTEINAAYLRGHNERWRNEPFVIGQHIHVSPQHVIDDICNDIEGFYPKDFIFAGWHSNCLCTSDPIMIDGEEKKEFYRRLMAGEDMSNYVSPFAIKDVPEQYKQYIEDNEEAIMRAFEKDKLAWHLVDNKKYWQRYMSPENQEAMGVKSLSSKERVLQAAEKRHAERNAKQIQLAWTNRRTLAYKVRMNDVISRLSYTDNKTMGSALQARYDAVLSAIKHGRRGSVKDVEKLYQHFVNGASIRERWDKLLWDGLSREQIANCREIEKKLGILKGRPMNWEQANNGRENPYYRFDKQYRVNCQTCTIVNELRCRGFNIVAKGKAHGFDTILKTKMNWKQRFVNNDEYIKSSVWAQKHGYSQITKKRIEDFLFSNLKQDGRYEIYCQWKGGGAHVFSASVKNHKLLMFDPQTGKSGANVIKYIDNMKGKGVWVMRVDNKVINLEMSKAITTKKNLKNFVFGIPNNNSTSPASLFTDINKSISNKEKTSLLKSYIHDKANHFTKINRYSSKNGSIFTQYASEYDKAFKYGEMPKNLDMARKLAKLGYDVYMMPNPSESNSFDFIITKKGKIYDIEGKAFNGANTLDHLLDKGVKQSSRILVDAIGNTNTKYIFGTTKSAFERNSNLSEIWLLKGSKLVKVTRNMYASKHFDVNFKKSWNK